jgi:asparagine synthase (glutamine-hydrolysing)
MCGIAALFAYSSSARPVDPAELEWITQRMFARGPDAGGTWISADARVGLGSRRLAIIDLTDEGTQPLTDVDGELTIVFNGEIYNYAELRARLLRFGVQFHSTSDTEVLLQTYRRDGERMTELLRGMFAFVIWDARTRRMFVARDPYGIKPLYFADDGRTFRAASQVKALLAGGAVSPARDPAAVAGFFVMGSVPGPLTICEAVRAVDPGTSFFVDENGRSTPRRFYSVAAALQHGKEQRAIAELVTPQRMLREIVTESLRYHLVADVPVGAFLSSGIDSSALVALASRMRRQPLRTVTLTYEEYRGRADDEAPMAVRFAKEVGADHVTRMVTRSEFLADLPKLFDAMDQPTIDGVNTWFVSKAAAERGLKVALSGLGGDELFGSYPSFRTLPRMVRASSIPLATALAARIRRHPKARAVPRYAGTWAGAYLVQRALFLPDELPEVIGPELAEEGLRRLQIVDRIDAALAQDPGTPFGRVAALEASLYMRNQLLRDTDWASMAHSLEVRTPLVDAHLLRQLAPLLVAYRAECKRFFGLAPDPPLPPWLRERRKTGFRIPVADWMHLQPDGTTTGMRSWARVVWKEGFAR